MIDKNTAIKAENISKTFRIPASPAGGPHEKISSLRGAFVNLPAKLCGAFWAGVFRSNGYEEFKALDGVSFEVRPVKSGSAGSAKREFNGVKKGKFFGIIGRNGSGKSTLFGESI